MFFETKYNYELFTKKYKIPFLVFSVGTLSPQMDTERPNGYICHHVLWVTEGRGLFTFGGKSFTLEKGQGIFIKSGVPHSYYADCTDFSTAWVTFYGADGLFDYYGITDYKVFTVPPFLPAAASVLDELCANGGDVLARSAAGYSFINDLFVSCLSDSTPFGRRVDLYLEANYKYDLSLEDIGNEMKMNKFTLCHRYREEQGFSVMEQLKRIRIAKAKQYLAGTDSDIAEVGRLCGFESPSYFGKVFREQTGMTPLQYRKKWI